MWLRTDDNAGQTEYYMAWRKHCVLEGYDTTEVKKRPVQFRFFINQFPIPGILIKMIIRAVYNSFFGIINKNDYTNTFI